MATESERAVVRVVLCVLIESTSFIAPLTSFISLLSASHPALDPVTYCMYICNSFLICVVKKALELKRSIPSYFMLYLVLSTNNIYI